MTRPLLISCALIAPLLSLGLIGLAEALPFVSLSHEVNPEWREYERTASTVANAYIGPKVGGYVKSLKSSLGEIGFAGNLSIMRSNGGVMTPEVATERPAARSLWKTPLSGRTSDHWMSMARSRASAQSSPSRSM